MLKGWFQYFDYHGNERLSKSELLRGIVKTYDVPCQRMLPVMLSPTKVRSADFAVVLLCHFQIQIRTKCELQHVPLVQGTQSE